MNRRVERERGVLHLFPQYAHHCEAYIVGTREELQALQEAITEALVLGDAELLTMASDGEGYDVNIVLVDQAQSEKLATAYTADYAQDSHGLHPYTILKERYEQREQQQKDTPK